MHYSYFNDSTAMNKFFTTLIALLITIAKTHAGSGTSITQIRDGVTFTFEFNCNGGSCTYGQFVNGDYWVIPSTPDGVVTVTSMSPAGEANGALVNPDLQRDISGNIVDYEDQKQGILNAYDHYDGDLNLMNHLPYQARANESIFKIKSQNTGCGTRAIFIGCVASASVLTVLGEAPPNDGATIFRPPFHGQWKPLYSTDKVKLERLPRLPQVSDGTGGVIGGTYGFQEWLTPQLELYHQGLGEFHRATIPHLAQTPYAADQAFDLLRDIGLLFGKETEEDKKMATYSIIQKGIDNYGVYKLGIPFSSGAGQHLGKKPPLAFFAALYDDVTLLDEIRSIATNVDLQNARFFQEDAQIRVGPSGMAVWGEFDHTFENVHWYFSRLYPRLDNNGALGDPYMYIDGPAGGIYPDENQTSDRNYLPVAGGPLISYAFLQHLMPWYKYAAGDPEILLWSDRFYSGYGIDNFDGGLWTKPDPVAPYDVSESGCNPFRMYSTGITGCTNYGVTWGPKLDDLSQFIPHNGNPNTDGRMPELHGYKIEVNRLSSLVSNHWDELRPCADSKNGSYPCEGLGIEAGESTTDPDTSPTNPGTTITSIDSKEDFLTNLIYPNPSSGMLNLPRTATVWEVYNLSGQKILETSESELDMRDFPKGLYLFHSGGIIQKIKLQ